MAESAGPLGELQAVVVAEERRGNPARVTDSEATLRGSAPYATLARPLDPDVVESEFDLGWLAYWWPRRHRQWDLGDLADGVVLRSGAGSPFSWRPRRPAVEHAVRTRLGWVADDERLAPATAGWTSPWRAVVTTSAPAEELLDQVRSVLALVPEPGSPAPAPAPVWSAWLRDAWMPPRGEVDWAAWHRSLRRLDLPQAHRQRWRATWTRERWERSVLPGERTWRWLGATVTGARTLEVDYALTRPSAPRASLTWLLLVAGATACRPVGQRSVEGH